MGVDAQMMFTLDKEPTAERLLDLQYILLERIGKEWFWCSRYEHESKQNKPVPFLEPITEFIQDGDFLDLSNMVEIKLSYRYYGPDYERGPALQIIGTIMVLLSQPDVTGVWYGGDSSGICAEKYDVTKVVELLTYYSAQGNIPYYKYFDRNTRNEGTTPECSYCHKPLCRNGFGGRYAGFYCLACGESLKLKEEVFDQWAAGTLDVGALPRFNGVAQAEDRSIF